MAINIREGRWGVSRIVQEADGGYAVAAMLQTPRLADQVSAYYPPLQDGVYPVGWALVHLVGNIGTPDADTRLLPDRLTTATVGDLTQQQRNTLRNVLEQALSAYSYVDRYGATINKAAFQAAGYSLSTPIFRILRDVYEYLGHSETRPVQAVPESHNTEYLDNFSTDPSSRWTADSATLTWDSGNSELDSFLTSNTLWRYTANDPGSIEHEAQVTLQSQGTAGSSNRTPGPLVRGSATSNGYQIHDNGDDVIPLARWNSGTRTALAAITGNTARNPGDFQTLRLAASGAAGSAVVLSYWQTVHGATKPSDPGWIGVDETPGFTTYSDTDATNRHDDSDDIYCGIGGRSAASDSDPRLSFWKSRAISDRGGGSISASLSKTLDTIGLSTSIETPAQASLARTLDGIGLSTSIETPAVASLSRTLDGIGLSAQGSVGTVISEATLSRTLDSVSLTTSVETPARATLAGTLGSVGLTTSVETPARAALGATLGGVTLSATGSIGQLVSEASLSQTLASISLTAAADTPAKGSLTSSLSSVSLAAAVDTPAKATLARTLDGVGLAATGVVGGVSEATLAATLAGLTLAAAVDTPARASLARTLDGIGLSAAGEVTGLADIQASLAKTLDAATLVSAGTIRVAATLARSLDSIGLSATATLGGAIASAAITLEDASLFGRGKVYAAGTPGVSGTVGRIHMTAFMS